MMVTDESCTWSSELPNLTTLCPRWHVSVDSYSSTTKNMENGTDRCQPLSIKYCWAPEDAAVICFTSGTTGRPKGVTISHTSLITQSLAKIAIVGYTKDDVYLHTAPMCHIGGISSCLAMLMAGGCHVVIPKFVAEIAVEAIRENRVTSLIAVPTILADLVSTIRHKQPRTQELSLKKILNGGGSLSIQLIADAMECFPKAKLLSAYGMTETCSSLTFTTLYDPVEKNSDEHLDRTDKQNPIGGVCVGKPAPHVEILVSEEDSSHVGRIMTRGPHVMIRYWGQNTTRVPDSGEDWFETGDIGQFDAAGNLWLVGRRNGRIKSGGENVYPEEVEAVLSLHPGISSVVVTGIPNARLGEMVVACVQIRENWVWADNVGNSLGRTKLYLSNEVLKEYCRHKRLTGFKIPKVFIVWRKPFPLTSTGKLRRDEMKKEAMMQLQPLLSSL
ncbi:2-succinylbenzoate--CoA ligase, chloroplastic/peroxisomal isoform X2 [Silene latifolia]